MRHVDQGVSDEITNEQGGYVAGDDLPSPNKKRARHSETKPKAPRKKYVRGKQGSLKGLMNMPIEIFTEVSPGVRPDLLF
jgi:hypothetical protein